ncbi:MAG TPA: thiamine phosphate synthase [Terriglobales bacterium]|nr:thiamine phosphate synthase [Terriglobales bacterium]
MPSPDFALYLVTDRTQTRGRDLLWVLEQALDAGVKAIQLREKDLSGKELFELALKIQQLCERYTAQLFINDRVDVALAVDAAGVQLSKYALPVTTARALLGPKKLIGVSTHTPEEAETAELNGADFILFGPVYFTPSKASYGAPQGIAPLQKTLAKTSLPVYAIGGIKAENVPEIMGQTTIRGIALISAILNAADPKNAAHALLMLLTR